MRSAGPSLILVVTGTVTNYPGDDPSCTPRTYSEGAGFIDPGGEHLHMLRNETGDPAETIAVQLLPRMPFDGSPPTLPAAVPRKGGLGLLARDSRVGPAWWKISPEADRLGRVPTLGAGRPGVVVALVALLAAGRWLQPQLGGRAKAPATTSAAPTMPVPTDPAPASPTLATDRLLGLGGPEVRGPRRNLHELHTDRITAVAAATDGGLWLGTAEGLFHVDPSVLGQG